MLKALIDANIIVTLITNREDPFLQDVKKLFQLCAVGRFDGYVALQTVSIVWYVLRKTPECDRRSQLKDICKLLNLAVTGMEAVRQALGNTAFADFEDNLQDCCARNVGADYIVTANVSDYEGQSVVQAVTPAEFLAILEETGSDSASEIHEQHVEYTAGEEARPIRKHWHVLLPRYSA